MSNGVFQTVAENAAPPHTLVRVDPPPDVLAAVAALERACQSWPKVAVPLGDVSRPRREAMVCKSLDDGGVVFDGGDVTLAGAGLFAVVVAVAAVRFVLKHVFEAFERAVRRLS
jgi:hypothetical protein